MKLIKGDSSCKDLSIYNTLSHRWSQSAIVKLDKSTLQTLRAGLAEDLFPRTFELAMRITRAMGVPYLWIDSLSIQQDDPSDWLNEAVQMDKVYSLAYCNIAATADDCKFGDLRQYRPSPELILDTLVMVACRSNNLPKGIYRVIQDGYFDRDIHEAPLNQRGWVFQERFFSRRILNLTTKELMWECQTLSASGSWPMGVPGPVSTRSRSFGARAGLALGAKQSHQDAKAGWRAVVAAYSKTALTYAQDRSVAISGIAKEFQSLLKDDYLAGMWKSNIVSNLLWHVDDYAENIVDVRSKDLENTSPSFSWLSLENAVRLGSEENAATLRSEEDDPSYVRRVPMAKFVRSELDYVTHDRTGPLRFGKIFLSGSLREIRLSRNDKWTIRPMHRRHKPYWKMTFEGNECDSAIWPDFGRCDLPRETTSHRHFILPLLGHQSSFSSEIRIDGLVLEQTDPKLLSFRRIGTFVLAGPSARAVLGKIRIVNGRPDLQYDFERAEHIICIE